MPLYHCHGRGNVAGRYTVTDAYVGTRLVFGAIGDLMVARVSSNRSWHMGCPHVNPTKTHLFFSKNVDINAQSAITTGFGICVVDDSGRYLGAAKSLSLAGRITLAKTVLQVIPVYVLQSTWIPKGDCDDMEKVIRSFVWGSSDEKRNISLINWPTMQTPTEEGGLDFKVDKGPLWVHCVHKGQLVPTPISSWVTDDACWDRGRLQAVLPAYAIRRIEAVLPPREELVLEWDLLFAIICWSLWNKRNRWIFYEDHVEIVPLLDSCLKLYQEVGKMAANYDIVVKPTVHNESNLCKQRKPPMGWVRERDEAAACGGIIQNDQGEWIFGFSRSLGVCSPFWTELWALHDGLKHVWSLGFRKIEV
ncbi:hypothetical protein F3Y22_tig00110694pilonHSYRG00213 [Hibiscus syriacus]|uniref:RNase H type-1 domain-containing protein n=1 Tax=Hibiscus syriacus TaxID=106335 RepID=A0A6A2ZUT5_HIBSY|nr:hypothetical protein F3Y22_tig00110694pilonHSYRG00213 [Hibiscus syriacus]